MFNEKKNLCEPIWAGQKLMPSYITKEYWVTERILKVRSTRKELLQYSIDLVLDNRKMLTTTTKTITLTTGHIS